MGTFVPSEIIEEILSRVSIVDVVSRYVRLKKTGKNFVGLCPFHSEKTPSFTVNESKGLFYCFGCSEGGNVISFIMKIENLSFSEALEHLGEIAGVDLSHLKKSLPPEEIKKRKKLQEIFRVAADFYRQRLLSDEGKNAREYIKERGISERTSEKFFLGYAPSSGNSLLNFLLERRFTDEEIISSSLITPHGAGRDFFRNRLIFPIFNAKGEIVGFGGRSLDDSSPKYLNSTENPLFQKRKILYGFNMAKSHIQELGYVVIVEGYIDVIMMHQYGFNNTVGTLGTSLSDFHIRELKRLTREIKMLYDGDESGIKSAMRSLDVLVRNELTPKFVPLPPGKDPDDYLRSHGEDGMRNLLSTSKPFVEYYIDFQLTSCGESVDGKKEGIKKVCEILQLIVNPVEREHYIKYASRQFGISEGTIKDILKGESEENGRVRYPLFQDFKDEDILLNFVLTDKNFLSTLEEMKILELIKDGEVKRILNIFLEKLKENPGFNFSSLLSELGEEEQKIISSRAIKELPEGVNVEKLKREILLKLQLKRCEEELSRSLSVQEKERLFREKLILVEELRKLTIGK